jgi:hypothetical protein
MLPPQEGRRYVSEVVYDNIQVRLVTGSFKSAALYLDAIGIDLGIPSSPTGLPIEKQFLFLASAIFDAYAAARHLVVHVGASTTGGTIPHCAHRYPVAYLDGFLGGLVTLIERARSRPLDTQNPR